MHTDSNPTVNFLSGNTIVADRVSYRRSPVQSYALFNRLISKCFSDSIEDMEFVGDDTLEEEPPKRSQLHIVAPWINTDADFTHLHSWGEDSLALLVDTFPLQTFLSSITKCRIVYEAVKEKTEAAAPAADPLRRTVAALALLAQLAALLAAALDVRLPHALALRWATGRSR